MLEVASSGDRPDRAPGNAPVTGIQELCQVLRGDWEGFQKVFEESLRSHLKQQEAIVRRQECLVEVLLAKKSPNGFGGQHPPSTSYSQAHLDHLETDGGLFSVVPMEGNANPPVDHHFPEATEGAAVARPCGPCLGASAPVVALGCGMPASPPWLRCWPLRKETSRSRPSLRKSANNSSQLSPRGNNCMSASGDLGLREAAISGIHHKAEDTQKQFDLLAKDTTSPMVVQAQQVQGEHSGGSTGSREVGGEARGEASALSSDPHTAAPGTQPGASRTSTGHSRSTTGKHSRRPQRSSSNLFRGKSFNSRAPSESAVNFYLEMEHGSKLKRTMYSMFSHWIDWWMNLKEPERKSWLSRKVSGTLFNTLCAIVIIANGLFVAWTTNQDMKTNEPPNEISDLVEMGFLVFYCIELCLKLTVHGFFYFGNSDWMWNGFDCFLVLTSILSYFFTAATMNFSFVRAVRIFKMAKVLRVVRVMRFFTELRLILNSLLGSFASLFWSVVMLGLIMYIFGLMFVQEAATYIRAEGDRIDRHIEADLRDYYGSVQIAMVTLYMTATGGDDWNNFYRPISACGPMARCLFLFFVAFIIIAVLNVLTGIFVENAMRLAVPDKDTQALEHRKRELAEASDLRHICQEIDKDRSGTINMTEFKDLISSGKVRAHLSLLGLHIKDAEAFLRMLAASSEEEEVDIETIVQGCMRMKGAATSLDMQNLVFITKMIHKHQKKFESTVARKLGAIEEEMISVLGRLGLEAEALRAEKERQAQEEWWMPDFTVPLVPMNSAMAPSGQSQLPARLPFFGDIGDPRQMR